MFVQDKVRRNEGGSLEDARQSALSTNLIPVPHVGFLQRVAYPPLQACDLGPRILRRSSAGAERREADPKAEIVDVLLLDVIRRRRRNGWVFKELKHRVARVAPTPFVLRMETLRVGQGLAEGYDGHLAVDRSGEFRGLGQDDGFVERSKNSSGPAVSVSDRQE